MAGSMLEDPIVRPSLDTYLRNWIFDRCHQSDRLPCPIIIAAAEGGGLRAASWTASTLSAMDKKTHCKFSHTFSRSAGFSGVVSELRRMRQHLPRRRP